MGKATRGFHDRIIVAFDFDQTLAPGTVEALVERLGMDPQAWDRDYLKPLVKDGWDEIIAHGPALLRAAEECQRPITCDLVREIGRELPVYDGVEETLRTISEVGKEQSGGADVELYVLSCGFEEIMCETKLARVFEDMWGSAFHWSEDGKLLGVKRTVIHSEKARYLMALAKGLDMTGANEPQDVHVEKPIEEWHAPYDQMIYVGDGISDIAAFNLMHDNGGIAIGVNQSEDGEAWAAADHIFEGARVDNVAAPAFAPDGELHRSLLLSVECVAKRVALRRLAKHD